MKMKTTELFCLPTLLLLLILIPQSSAGPSDPTAFRVLVTDSVTHTPEKIYSTYVMYRGILLGGLRRLHNSTADFSFTFTEDPNYGPYLESVNGLAGSPKNSTYWELLSSTPANGTIPFDVGIGCIIPKSEELIILKYTKYGTF